MEEEYYEEEVIEDDMYDGEEYEVIEEYVEDDEFEEEVIVEEEVLDESEGAYEEYTIATNDINAGASPFDPQGWRQQGVVQSQEAVAPSSTFTPKIVSDPPPAEPARPAPTRSVKELTKNFNKGAGGVQPQNGSS